jgi:hypothetical protein
MKSRKLDDLESPAKLLHCTVRQMRAGVSE